MTCNCDCKCCSCGLGSHLDYKLFSFPCFSNTSYLTVLKIGHNMGNRMSLIIKIYVCIYIHISIIQKLSHIFYNDVRKILQAKRRISEEARKKQEQEDEKLAQRLQADENRQDGHMSTPHLLHAVKYYLQMKLLSIMWIHHGDV